ncbi:MAG: hypothetical protein ACLFUX_04485 [Spirochaetaceae bacterium]
MKRAHVPLYLFLLVLVVLIVEPSHGQAMEVKVRNETEYPMLELYVLDEDAGRNAETGENLLVDGPLLPGGETTIALSPADRFLLSVDEEGDRYLLQGPGAAEGRLLTIALDDLHFGGDQEIPAAASGRRVRLVNDTGYRLLRLWYRWGSEGAWSELERVGAIASGATTKIRIPSADDPAATLSIRGEDEDGDYYEKHDLRVHSRRQLRFTVDDMRFR